MTRGFLAPEHAEKPVRATAISGETLARAVHVIQFEQ